MTGIEEQYLGNHRRQQSLTLVVSILGLLLAIAPRQERALFITDGQGLKAFAAEFPPIHPVTLLNFPYAFTPRTGPLAAFFARTPQPVAGPAVFTPAQPGGPAAPFAGAPNPAGVAGGSPFAQPAGTGAGGQPNAPFTPAGFSNPNPSPVGPAAGGGTTPTPVGAVPEPGAWMMLIVGLAIIGAVVRRRSRSGYRLDLG